MRRLAAILGATALLAGCGSAPGDEASAPRPMPKGDFGPTEPGKGEFKRPEAPPEKKPSASVASALAAGTVGVIGVEGDVGVRPRTLEVTADTRLQGLKWEGWGTRSASGEGRLVMRDCNPTCASGGLEAVEATVRLSSPRLCGEATYFDKARVEIGDDAPPTSYVRAPC